MTTPEDCALPLSDPLLGHTLVSPLESGGEVKEVTEDVPSKSSLAQLSQPLASSRSASLPHQAFYHDVLPGKSKLQNHGVETTKIVLSPFKLLSQ